MTATLDRITVRCEGCGAKLGINANTTKKHVKCPKCGEIVSVTQETDVFSNFAQENPLEAVRAKVTQQSQDRPWQPGMLPLVALAAGPFACGVAAGVNFARMGKRVYLIPCIVAGLVMLIAQVFGLALFVKDPNAFGFVGKVLSVVIGLGFMLAHQETFEEWQDDNWVPKTEDEAYSSNRRGLLLLIMLLCMGLQLGVASVLELFATGKL